jgi:hypothetical protein
LAEPAIIHEREDLQPLRGGVGEVVAVGRRREGHGVRDRNPAQHDFRRRTRPGAVDPARSPSSVVVHTRPPEGAGGIDLAVVGAEPFTEFDRLDRFDRAGLRRESVEASLCCGEQTAIGHAAGGAGAERQGQGAELSRLGRIQPVQSRRLDIEPEKPPSGAIPKRSFAQDAGRGGDQEGLDVVIADTHVASSPHNLVLRRSYKTPQGPFGFHSPIKCQIETYESGGFHVSISYSDLYEIDHNRDYEEDVRAGDLVRTGPNLFPHFIVVAVAGDKAWVRNVQTGVDGIAQLSRCRKINGEPLDAAVA